MTAYVRRDKSESYVGTKLGTTLMSGSNIAVALFSYLYICRDNIRRDNIRRDNIRRDNIRRDNIRRRMTEEDGITRRKMNEKGGPDQHVPSRMDVVII
jgi:hypothetical protein